jgi:hypothetical protein
VLLGPGEEVEGVDPAPKGTTPRHRSSRMRIHRGTWATRSNLLNKLSLPFPGNSLEIPSWARSPSPILGATNKSKTTAPKSPATANLGLHQSRKGGLAAETIKSTSLSTLPREDGLQRTAQVISLATEGSVTSLKPRDLWVFRVLLLVSLFLDPLVTSSVLTSLV